MPKRKSAAQVFVADGQGGMRQIIDRRFEESEWPIDLVIPAKDAENWMAHLAAETEARSWSMSAFSELDPLENSGTLSINTGNTPIRGTVEMVWEKTRGGAMRLRARTEGEPIPSIDIAWELLNRTNARQREGTRLRAHQRALLIYHGLPWRGELWLDTDHRLGPPSQFPDALIGPQVVVVDAMVEGIGSHGTADTFQRRLHEIRVFMGAVIGQRLSLSKFESDWVCEVDQEGKITGCTLRPVGYIEREPIPGFPQAGSARPIERRAAPRPGLGPFGITSDMHERWVPTDIEQLWSKFTELSDEKREHFLRAGNAHLIARQLWPEQRTASAAFLVVACEALKPSGRRYEKANVYDIIASLVSPAAAAGLRQHSRAPQKVRSGYLHRGELAAGELLPMMMRDYFQDPSFDNMLDELTKFCRVCLIEWLRCKGEYKLAALPRE